MGCLLFATPILSLNVHWRGVKSPPSSLPTQQHIQHPQSPVLHREQQVPSQQGQDDLELDEPVVQKAPPPRPKAPTKSVGQVFVADEERPTIVRQHATKSLQSPTKSVVRQVAQEEQEEQLPQAPSKQGGTKSVKQVPQQRQTGQEEELPPPPPVPQRPVYSTKTKAVGTKTKQVPERPVPQPPTKSVGNRKTVQRVTPPPPRKTVSQPPQVYDEDSNDEQDEPVPALPVAVRGVKSPPIQQSPVKTYQRPVVIYVQELPQVAQDTKKPAVVVLNEPPRKNAQLPSASRKVPRAPVDAVQKIHHSHALIQ